MADITEIKVPDIGEFDAVEVIEVLVSPGDTVQAEDSLISIESDKASMEIPSPGGGTIKEVAVKVGDKVSEGDDILTLEVDEESSGDSEASEASSEKEENSDDKEQPSEAKA
jgi:pyruvate/2-oxoglutarate dehydrogenase complex dihydrolipoamide acyltransferase (E2) component